MTPGLKTDILNTKTGPIVLTHIKIKIIKGSVNMMIMPETTPETSSVSNIDLNKYVQHDTL
jgi:hypothetical protein